MRYRSIGVSASNIRDYLTRIKEVEDNYINESTLAHIGFISLEEKKFKNELLGPNSLYKLTFLKAKGRRKKRKMQYYRKKLFFYHQTKLNSRNNNNCNQINN